MSNNNATPADAAQVKPADTLGWDTEDAGEDFLENVQMKEAPKACSILEPDCEACQ